MIFAVIIAHNDFIDNLNEQLCIPGVMNHTSFDFETFPRLEWANLDCVGDNPKIVADCLGYCQRNRTDLLH